MNEVPQRKWVRMPAVSWNRLLVRSTVVIFGVYGLFLLVEVFGLADVFDSSLSPWLFVPAGILVAVTLVSRLGRHLADSAESVAGYTTLTNEHQNLPQLDPRTGRVIRPAGGTYLTKNQLEMALHGVLIPPLRTGFDPLSATPDRADDAAGDNQFRVRPRAAVLVFQGLMPVLAVTVGGVVLLSIRNNKEGHFVDVGTFLRPGLVVVPWVLGFYVLVARSVWCFRIFLTRPLRLQNTASLVFSFSRSKDFQEGLSRLQRADPVAPAAKMVMVGVADSVGIRIYQSTPALTIASIPWKDIVSVAVETAQVFRSMNLAAVITVLASQGTVSLPLASASVSNLPVKSGAETRWVTQQLELMWRQHIGARR